MAEVLLVSAQGLNNHGSSATGYTALGNGAFSAAVTDVWSQVTWRTPGVIRLLYVRVVTNDCGTSTIRLRKNGADGNGVISIPPSTTGEFRDVTNTDTVTAGDEINVSVVSGAGTTFIPSLLAALFAATTNTATKLLTIGGPSDTGNGVTRYYGVAGSASGTNTTEAVAQYSMRQAGTWSDLQCSVRANSRSTTTTVRSRKNLANGNQVVSIPASNTGIFEDASNTDTLASGDEIDYAVELGADAGTFRAHSINSEFTTTNGAIPIIGTRSGVTSLLAGTTYYLPMSLPIDAYTAEDVRQEALLPFVASKMQCYVSVNTVLATSTLRLRKNGANGNQVISVPTLTTGVFEDASNTDSYAATDEMNYSFAIGAGGTSIGVTVFGVVADFSTARPVGRMYLNQAVKRAAYF